MDDYISREAAIQAIEDIDENAGARGSGFTDPERIMRDSAFCALEAIQPADVRPVVRAHYITDELGDSSCSECGEPYLDITKNFCPNCGADMRPNLDATKGERRDESNG